MHADPFDTLEKVVAHYVRAPRAAVGHTELANTGHAHAERKPTRLSEQEVADVVAFLRALTSLPE